MPSAPVPPAPAGPPGAGRGSAARYLTAVGPFAGLSLLLFLVGLGVVFLTSGVPGGLPRSLTALWAEIGLFACAAALPLSVRNLDLSLAGAAALCGLVFGAVSGVPGLLAGVVVALVVGVVNGALAGLLRLHSALTTLATGSAMLGLVVLVTSAEGMRVARPLPPLFGVAVLVLLLLGAVAVDLVTVLGVRVELPDQARRALMHVVAGLLAGLAGIVLVSHIQFVSPGAVSGGNNLFLGFAAALVGGTSASGGWRSLVGAVLAAGFLATVSMAASLLDVGVTVVWLVAAALLLVGLGGDRLRASLTKEPQLTG